MNASPALIKPSFTHFIQKWAEAEMSASAHFSTPAPIPLFLLQFRSWKSEWWSGHEGEWAGRWRWVPIDCQRGSHAGWILQPLRLFPHQLSLCLVKTLTSRNGMFAKENHRQRKSFVPCGHPSVSPFASLLQPCTRITMKMWSLGTLWFPPEMEFCNCALCRQHWIFPPNILWFVF